MKYQDMEVYRVHNARPCMRHDPVMLCASIQMRAGPKPWALLNPSQMCTGV